MTQKGTGTLAMTLDYARRTIESLREEVETWKSRYSETRSALVKLHDDTDGTPCEQIRHAQDMAEMTARAERAEAEAESLRRDAGRYRHLRDVAWSKGSLIFYAERHGPEDWDRAVDLEMAGEAR